jgi:hypothetical protein
MAFHMCEHLCPSADVSLASFDGGSGPPRLQILRNKRLLSPFITKVWVPVLLLGDLRTTIRQNLVFLERNSAAPLRNSKDGLHLSPAGGGETPEGVSGVDSWVYILGAAKLRCALCG